MLVEAFTKVPIVQRLPEQITAMDSWSNTLMLGTRQGNVNVYTVTPNETDSREFKVKVVHAIKLRKPIVQLRLLPKLNCLLVLSDHVISVYDLRTYQLTNCLSKTRGTVAFTVDQSLLSSAAPTVESADAVWVDAEGNDVSSKTEEEEKAVLLTRVAVSTKRRVLVFETYSDWSKLKETHNLMIPDARVLLFFNQVLYLANKNEYVAVQLSNCDIFDLFSVGTSEPGIFLIASDTVGFLQDQKMALVSPRPNQRVRPTEYSRVVAKLNWSEAPASVLPASWPYLIALLPSCVEVRVRESRQLVQQEMFDRPRLLAPQAPEAAASARLAQVTATVASRRIGAGGVRRPAPETNRTQSVTGPQPPVNTLEASAVYVASGDHVWRLVGVDRVRQVQQLMERREYDLAWHLAGTVPAPEALERVLPLREIGTMHAFTLFSREQRFEEAFSILGDLRVDPSHVVGLLRGGLLPDEYQSKIRYPGELPRLNEEHSKKAMRALMGYLLMQRNILLSPNTTPDMYHPIMPESISIASRPHHLRQVIDTSLFKCYLFTKQDTLLESFLRLPDNACHFEETEHTLKQQQRYNDLLVLYESRGDHRKALKFLLAQSQKAGSLLFGPLPTVRYLQKLGPKHWDVICEFSKWVLERHPEDGLRIFTDYASEPLPRWKVYEFLHDAAPRQVIAYLEHVTSLSEEETDLCFEERIRFHNRLGDELILQVKSLAEDSVRGLPESQQHLVDSGGDAGSRKEVMAVRSRLQDFLETSTHYTPRKLLLNYPVDSYFEERALLYARMGRLRHALALWLHVLEVPERAEAVARIAYDNGATDAFLCLMEVALLPPTASQLEIVLPTSSARSTPEAESGVVAPTLPVCLDYGLKMLERYGSRIDAARAVALLPESVALSAVIPYLKTALEAKERRRRHQELQRQLCYAELLQRQEVRMAVRAQKIELAEDEKCAVCGKRLGANTAFGRYPDGRLAHYACCQDLPGV